MNSKEIIQKLKELNLPQGRYAVFGSGPLTARGLRESEDLDLIVADDFFQKYEKEEGWQVKQLKKGYGLTCGNVELIREWWPGEWNIEKLIKEADIIKGFPFVRLEEVLKWKKMRGAEKDLKDIRLIEDFLSNENK